VRCSELELEGELDGAGAADLVEGVERIVGVGIPPPGFFVSVADKGLRYSVSSLESTLTDSFASVASKGVTGA
jgi:hypothetical protein